MARNTIVLISLAVLAFVCLLETTSAFDLIKYLQERLMETIKKEHITCSNYEKFCVKSNEELSQTSNGSKDDSVNAMAIELCKAIVKPHVCLNEIYETE